MSKAGAFLAGFCVAAALAAGAWGLVVAPRAKDREERTVAAERATLRAKRDADDAQQWADSENRRRLALEEEVTSLRRTITAEPPPRPPMGPHDPPKPDTSGLPPEQWDGARRRQEIGLLETTPRGLVSNPRYALVVRAVKAHVEEDLPTLAKVMGSELSPAMKSVCAMLLGALDDVRAVKPLLTAWTSAADPDLRQAILQGLANSPGSEATPILVEVWNDPNSGSKARLLAIHGLARRRHEIAMKVAAGGAPGSTAPRRQQALQTLHAQALTGNWQESTLVPVFLQALQSADGPRQQQQSLLALEGFWSKDSVAGLEAFAESVKSDQLAARARKAADAIRDGKPRPEGAGVPPARPGVGAAQGPGDTEPAEAHEPPSAPPAPSPVVPETPR